MDPDSMAILRGVAGREHGIPAGLHGRLNGDGIGTLRKDAAKLAVAIGVAEPVARDQSGKFTMSDRIRRASGRQTAETEAEVQA